MENKIKDLKRQISVVEAKTTQAYSDSDSDSFDPAYHIKGRIKKSKPNLLLAGYGVGN